MHLPLILSPSHGRHRRRFSHAALCPLCHRITLVPVCPFTSPIWPRRPFMRLRTKACGKRVNQGFLDTSDLRRGQVGWPGHSTACRKSEHLQRQRERRTVGARRCYNLWSGGQSVGRRWRARVQLPRSRGIRRQIPEGGHVEVYTPPHVLHTLLSLLHIHSHREAREYLQCRQFGVVVGTSRPWLERPLTKTPLRPRFYKGPPSSAQHAHPQSPAWPALAAFPTHITQGVPIA